MYLGRLFQRWDDSEDKESNSESNSGNFSVWPQGGLYDVRVGTMCKIGEMDEFH